MTPDAYYQTSKGIVAAFGDVTRLSDGNHVVAGFRWIEGKRKWSARQGFHKLGSKPKKTKKPN